MVDEFAPVPDEPPTDGAGASPDVSENFRSKLAETGDAAPVCANGEEPPLATSG